MNAETNKNALVLGGRTGLLGQSLVRSLERAGWRVKAVGRQDFDPFDTDALAKAIEVGHHSHVFNAIAYTKVDQAEDEPQAATRLNEDLPRRVGETVQRLGTGLVHFSTDFVFNGRTDNPYTPEDPTDPASVYGRTKLAGEQALTGLGLENLWVVRSSWLFGPGKENFVSKILDLAGQRDKLRVVHDQVGSPTYTPDLAANTVRLVEAENPGLYHLSCSGRASWCELAAEAVLIAGIPCVVEAISSDEFPQKASRPPYSVLDLEKYTQVTGHTPRPWVQALRDYVYRDLGYASGSEDT
jgi:dTDP-4-dehydrorhamnose reductase